MALRVFQQNVNQVFIIYVIITAIALQTEGKVVVSEIDWSQDCGGENVPKGKVTSLQLSKCNSETNCNLIAGDSTYELKVEFIPSTGHSTKTILVSAIGKNQAIHLLFAISKTGYPNGPTSQKAVFELDERKFKGTKQWKLELYLSGDEVVEVCKQFEVTIIGSNDGDIPTTEIPETSTSSAHVLFPTVFTLCYLGLHCFARLV